VSYTYYLAPGFRRGPEALMAGRARTPPRTASDGQGSRASTLPYVYTPRVKMPRSEFGKWYQEQGVLHARLNLFCMAAQCGMVYA
jgi:hypothetical protein